jgi:hypothetical protein
LGIQSTINQACAAICPVAGFEVKGQWVVLILSGVIEKQLEGSATGKTSPESKINKSVTIIQRSDAGQEDTILNF